MKRIISLILVITMLISASAILSSCDILEEINDTVGDVKDTISDGIGDAFDDINKPNSGNKDDEKDKKPKEKNYTLSVVVDEGLATVSKGGATVIALALVWDAEGKIVAARFDSVQPKFALNDDKTDIVAVDRVTTKVELGDEYNKMPTGTWENQAKAFENYIVGMTAAEVAALNFVVDGADAGLVAGCTMASSMPGFQALVAEAFAYERAVSFSTAETVTLGLAINCAVSGNLYNGGTITADIAGVALADGKVVAAMVDSMEGKYTLAIGEDQKLTVCLRDYRGTKNEQGDDYGMVTYSGAIAEWYAQAQAFADATVGKTVAELDAIDASTVAGCTIYAGGCKAAIVRAADYAR